MNLAAIQADMYRRLKFATAPDPSVTTRLTAYVNQTQREILGTKGYALLKRNVLPFSCVANTPFVVLPASVERIVTIQDRVNMTILDEVNIQDIRWDDPALSSTSTFPYQYAVLDYAAAASQDPSAAAAIYAKSDSASDNASLTVYLEGIVTNGYYQKASATLNGTTAVQIGSLATWTNITKFYVNLTAGGSTSATGNITLNQTSGSGTELARIAPGYSYARYVRIHLYPTPSQINTYYADVELHTEDMSQAGDEPLLPEDFHWLLISGGLMKEYRYREQLALEQMELGLYRNGMADLRMYLVRRSGVALGDTRRPRRFSQLGPYFPPGS